MFRALLNPNLSSFNRNLRFLLWRNVRNYSNFRSLANTDKVKVTICGANGQVGSIIAFLLKQSPLVDTISLYDIDCTYGTAMDISHIDTKCRVQSYSGFDDLSESLGDSKIIVICAGIGRTSGMCLNDLFEYNAPIVKQIAEAICKVNPQALVAILTNPLNSLVPLVSTVLKYANCYDPRKVFGITTIDSMRACTIIANDVMRGTVDPAEFLVPVIGGHSPETMVPVISQTTPCVDIPNVAFDFLVEKIRGASGLVTSLKSKGGPRLSVALGATRFINNLIRGLKNEKDVIELAYVHTHHIPKVNYFASAIELGPNGIKQNLGVIKIDEHLEKRYLKEAIRYLRCEIRRGESYVEPPSSTYR